jgi:hypothetical protein
MKENKKLNGISTQSRIDLSSITEKPVLGQRFL